MLFNFYNPISYNSRKFLRQSSSNPIFIEQFHAIRQLFETHTSDLSSYDLTIAYKLVFNGSPLSSYEQCYAIPISGYAISLHQTFNSHPLHWLSIVYCQHIRLAIEGAYSTKDILWAHKNRENYERN